MMTTVAEDVRDGRISHIDARVAMLEARQRGLGGPFGGFVSGTSVYDRQEQELRLKCLTLAKDAAVGQPDRVVKLAEQFHTFVLGKAVS